VLTAPGSVAVGTPAQVSAVVKQGTRTVPAAYPASASWSGSPNLHVGARGAAKPWHVAVLDPATGTLTALRKGQVTVAVTVNGVTRQATVSLTARAAA
ncbi:hypothetical protein, partial [Nonomuraea wenchangensis]